MDWLSIAGQIILVILGLVGTGIGTKLTSFLTARTSHVKAQWLQTLLGLVDKAAGDAVNATYNTIVNDLKAANADGKLTAAEAEAAAKHALSMAWASLTKDAQADLASFFGGTAQAQSVVGTAVEAKVANAKTSSVATPTATVASATQDQKQKAIDAAHAALGLSVK